MLIFKSQYNEYKTQGHIVNGITGQTCMLLYRDRGATVYTNYWATSFKKGILEATVRQMVEIYKKIIKKGCLLCPQKFPLGYHYPRIIF